MAKTMEYLLFTATSQQTVQARNNIADTNAAYSRTKFLSLKKPMATITNFSLLCVLWKDSWKHLRDVTIFAGRARMHCGEFYKNIFIKRSTLSTSLKILLFSDKSLRAIRSDIKTTRKTFFICIALFAWGDDVREIWNNQGIEYSERTTRNPDK